MRKKELPSPRDQRDIRPMIDRFSSSNPGQPWVPMIGNVVPKIRLRSMPSHGREVARQVGAVPMAALELGEDWERVLAVGFPPDLHV